MEARDHDLLHELSTAFLGKKAGPFNKAEAGVFERLDNVESAVADNTSAITEMGETVAKIWEKVK